MWQKTVLERDQSKIDRIKSRQEERRPIVRNITIDFRPDRDQWEFLKDKCMSDERWEKYKAGEVWDNGVYAKAEILFPMEYGDYLVQQIESGGVYGIPSDTDEPYLSKLQNEQLYELLDILQMMNIDISEGKIMAKMTG